MIVFDGHKLKQLRKERKFPQGALGQIVGRKTEHISNYENGHATPPSDVLLRLMTVFGIQAKDLAAEQREASGR